MAGDTELVSTSISLGMHEADRGTHEFSITRHRLEALTAQLHRVHHVGVDEQNAHHDHDGEHAVRQRHEARDIRRADASPAPQPRDLTPGALPEGSGHVAAVERDEGHQVEDEERDVERREEAEHRRQALTERDAGTVRGGNLAGETTNADETENARLVPPLM